MRPNIDISNELHGKIKDYAERKGIGTSEAYKQLLKKGLEVESG